MITERDIEVIQFLHDRLENVYKENKNVDYLIRTREIIDKLKEVHLPNVIQSLQSKSVENANKHYAISYEELSDEYQREHEALIWGWQDCVAEIKRLCKC